MFILFLQGSLDQVLRLRRRRWWRRTCRLGADVLLLFARRTPGEDYTFGVEGKKKGKHFLEGRKMMGKKIPFRIEGKKKTFIRDYCISRKSIKGYLWFFTSFSASRGSRWRRHSFKLCQISVQCVYARIV